MRSEQQTTTAAPHPSAEDMVRCYIDYNRRLNDLYLDLESYRRDGNLSAGQLNRDLREVRERAERIALELTRALADCTEEEQLALVTSPGEVYAELDNPWQLEDALARDALFHFIPNPGAAVRRAHERHRHQLQAAQKTAAGFGAVRH